MKGIPRLLETYLDDRDALSAEEMARLAAELDRSPALAEALQDQLVMRELLSQKLAEDRRNFPAQVGQRRRDSQRSEDELLRQVIEVRSMAADELRAQGAGRRYQRRLSFWIGLAGVLLVAVTAGVFWEQIAPQPVIAYVTAVEGELSLQRNSRSTVAARGVEVRAGDRLSVNRDGAATVRYADGTSLLLDGGAVVELAGRPEEAKHVRLLQGGMSASVEPQPGEFPLVVETAAALVRVMGTEFFAYTSELGAGVAVTEGRIALVRRSNGQVAEVAAGSSGFASPDVLRVWKGVWPSNPSGAALVLEGAPPRPAASDGKASPVVLAAQGRARLSEHGALVLDDGAFLAEGAGPAICRACQQSHELTVEAIVRPNAGPQVEAAVVFAAGDANGPPNFALVQSQGRFGFVLHTSDVADASVFDLADVAEELPQRLTITYRPGRLICYLEGKVLFERNDLHGDFRNWSPGDLLFGDQPDGGHNWRGVLEGIAVYNRALGKNEVQRNAAAYAAILEHRQPVSFSDQPSSR